MAITAIAIFRRRLSDRAGGGPVGRCGTCSHRRRAGRNRPMGLFVRTIGIARATVKIGLANIAYNMKRAVWLSERVAFA